jgi:hypothetical protein
MSCKEQGCGEAVCVVVKCEVGDVELCNAKEAGIKQLGGPQKSPHARRLCD